MPAPYNKRTRSRRPTAVRGNPFDWDYHPSTAPYGADYWHTHAYVPSFWKNRTAYGVEGYSNEPNYWSFAELWARPGSFTGRGPKGYTRSDDRIRDDIHERLTVNGQIDASDISVEVHGGEVTLTGTVNSRANKRLAEDIADSVTGVDDVHNELRIR